MKTSLSSNWFTILVVLLVLQVNAQERRPVRPLSSTGEPAPLRALRPSAFDIHPGEAQMDVLLELLPADPDDAEWDDLTHEYGNEPAPPFPETRLKPASMSVVAVHVSKVPGFFERDHFRDPFLPFFHQGAATPGPRSSLSSGWIRM